MVVSRRTYAGRAIGFARRQVLGIGQHIRDLIKPSYLSNRGPAGSLLRYLKLPSRGILLAHNARLQALSANYLAHRFDLLGSGWKQVKYGMRCQGVEGFRYEASAAAGIDQEGHRLEGTINRANLVEALRIWRLIGPDYSPIDWQRDFKSGYRWSEATWYMDIRYGHKPGADIKVPWELARMQHLPQLAWAYALASRGAEGTPERYLGEFRNQVLDFIATNPPRFGVNWRSAMEVAIRAANWAVAADLFRAGGASFDSQFETVLSRSLYEHGLHIEGNLEWDHQVRGNHYLANVAGLLLIAAFLPSAPKTDAWLAFAVRELVSEADFQFAPDGTHREASTNYHCLATEMMVYATAFVLALPQAKREALQRYDHRRMNCRPPLRPGPSPVYARDGGKASSPFPTWYFERLERMGEFVADISKPSGRVPQVGDNDSGRFLRFDSPYQQMTVVQVRACYANLANYDGLPDGAPYWDEDHLDHRAVAAAIGALFNRHDLAGIAGEGRLEAEVIRGLVGPEHLPFYRQWHRSSGAESVRVGSADQLRALSVELCAQGAARSFEIPAGAGGELREGLTCSGYPDFGLYIIRSERLYLAVRCGSFGLVGNGGHAHHDQLSIELSVGGRDLILDPGTYLYSAFRERRNQYRSVRSHFAPQVVGREPKGTGPGLFEMRDRANAKCLYFGPEGFAGCHWGYGPAVYRVIEIGADAIRITDGIKGDGTLCELTPAFGFGSGWREGPPPSPGYGIVRRELIG